MITAKEARELAGKNVQEKVEDICLAIEQAARSKARSLRTGWEYKDDRDLWVDGGYSRTKEWEEAKNMLANLGYKVTFYYKETQFVDMYTLIEW